MTSSSSFSNEPLLLLAFGLAVLAGCARPSPPRVLDNAPRVAVLPFENLSGRAAPLDQLRERLAVKMEARGMHLIDERQLEQLMEARRIRYAGGISSSTAQAFKETGADAVLITSVEFYSEDDPPKLALTSRLVSTDESPAILWMDGVALAGDDHPGVLELGRVADPNLLQEETTQRLVQSLADRLAGAVAGRESGGWWNRFRPRANFRSEAFEGKEQLRVVVVPFANRSERRHAGEILALHFVRQMTGWPSFSVIEPGVVREALLSERVIMPEGISLEHAEAIFGSLDSDLIVTGSVTGFSDYDGPLGNAKVEFSTIAIERESGEIAWASNSENGGNDGVFLFDFGRTSTASGLTSKMVRAVVDEMAQR